MYLAELERDESLGKIEVANLPLDSYVASCGETHIFMKECEFVHRSDPEGYESGLWVEVVHFTPNNPEADRVMHMQLTREFGEAYAVSMVRVDPKFKGFGLAPAVYKKLLQNTDIALVTDKCQTPGGQYIWNSLLGTKGIEIAAFNSKMSRVPRTLHPVTHGKDSPRLEVVGYSAWGEEGKNNWGFIMSRTPKRRSGAA